MNYQDIAQQAVTLILALTMSACLTDSEVNEFETEAVSLAITSPSSASALDTSDSAIRLAGTSSSDMGISRVSWANDRGGEGVANGTDSWQIASADVELGKNIITITAKDAAGAKTSRSIEVNRESGQTSSTTLSWTAPTARTDGSPLANLAGYKILYGRMSGIYDYQIEIKNPGISRYVVDDLVSGEWYFVLIAYDSEGLESTRSNEVIREIS